METSSFPEMTQGHQSMQNPPSEQHTQLQSHLIDLAYDAVIVYDPTDIILSWNRGAERLYGWRADEAMKSPNPIRSV